MMCHPGKWFALVALLGAIVILSGACGAGSPAETSLAQPTTPAATSTPWVTATATAIPPATATASPPDTSAERAMPAHTAVPRTPTAAVTTSTALPPTQQPNVAAVGLDCSLSPVIAPTAAPNPGQTERDPSTGLHVTGRAQMLGLATYRLRVTGLVDHPLELTYNEIRCLPRIEDNPLLTCPRTFQDRATWAGASLIDLLQLAGVQAEAEKVQFVSADGFKATLSLERALQPGNFLAYEWEGEPLPRLHGFPLRAVLPAEIGFYWVKWLVEIQVQ